MDNDTNFIQYLFAHANKYTITSHYLCQVTGGNLTEPVKSVFQAAVTNQ